MITQCESQLIDKIGQAKIDWNDEEFVEMMVNICISNENSSKQALNFIYHKNEYKNINKVKKDKESKTFKTRA